MLDSKYNQERKYKIHIMKNSIIYKLLLIFFSLGVIVSCVKDDDFDTPDTSVNEVTIDGTVIDIVALYDLWLQELNTNGNQTLTFDESSELYISGYVISSDEGGNFFEELILQNNASNPTRGVKVLIDVNPLFTTFEFGRKVYVKLDGLTVGLTSGVLTLGIDNGTLAEKIPESQLPEVVVRDTEVAEIVPLPMNISDFSLEKTNLFIRLSDVQFNRNEVIGDGRKTFAAEPSDEFDGERFLESCSEAAATIFSTSTFADFKAVLLPQGRGTLDGILTLNFFGDAFNVVVNDPTTINFDDNNRCDPETYVCNEPSGGGSAFFSENFESFNAIEDYVAAGWTNVNVNGGSTLYVIGNFDNNNYAQISGFNSGESEIETWLVTPAIDMDGTTGEELLFDIQSNFDNGTILSVVFSNNFSGDVTMADWQLLDANIPVGPEGGFGDFENVGPINVACIDGTVHFAFVYEGSDPNATTRYHIDNIEVTGN